MNRPPFFVQGSSRGSTPEAVPLAVGTARLQSSGRVAGVVWPCGLIADNPGARLPSMGGLSTQSIWPDMDTAAGLLHVEQPGHFISKHDIAPDDLVMDQLTQAVGRVVARCDMLGNLVPHYQIRTDSGKHITAQPARFRVMSRSGRRWSDATDGIELGYKVRHRKTQLVGIVIARALPAHEGPPQYVVREIEDRRPTGAFPESELVVLLKLTSPGEGK